MPKHWVKCITPNKPHNFCKPNQQIVKKIKKSSDSHEEYDEVDYAVINLLILSILKRN